MQTVNAAHAHAPACTHAHMRTHARARAAPSGARCDGVPRTHPRKPAPRSHQRAVAAVPSPPAQVRGECLPLTASATRAHVLHSCTPVAVHAAPARAACHAPVREMPPPPLRVGTARSSAPSSGASVTLTPPWPRATCHAARQTGPHLRRDRAAHICAGTDCRPRSATPRSGCCARRPSRPSAASGRIHGSLASPTARRGSMPSLPIAAGAWPQRVGATASRRSTCACWGSHCGLERRCLRMRMTPSQRSSAILPRLFSLVAGKSVLGAASNRNYTVYAALGALRRGRRDATAPECEGKARRLPA